MTKKSAPELKVQIAIIKWLRAVMPHAMIHHSVNEGNRSGKAGMLDGVRKKNAGMMPGFPDLIVLPYATTGAFFIEVKAAKGRVSPVQDEVHGMMERLGYKVCVAKSVDDVRDFMRASGIGFNEVQYDF